MFFAPCLYLIWSRWSSPDRISSPPDPDRLEHPGVSQLAATQLPCEHLSTQVSFDWGSILDWKWMQPSFLLWSIRISWDKWRLVVKTYQRLLELVGLDASDEEGVALSKRLHQQVRRLLELRRQSHLEEMEYLVWNIILGRASFSLTSQFTIIIVIIINISDSS